MPHPALEVVLIVLRRQLDELIGLESAVREDRPEAVHDMRTTVRRLRTTLAAARPVLDRRVTDGLRERLGELGAALEPARDAEVRAELASALLEAGGESGDDRAVRARLVDGSHDEYDRDRRALVVLLDRADHAALIADLSAVVRRPPVGEAAYRGQRSVLHHALARQARRAHGRIGRMDDDDLETLHDARKAVRRVRYLAEAIAEHAPKGGRRAAARLGAAAKNVQDALGDHRDAVLHARWIAREAEAAARAGENPEAYRRLERIELDRAQELVAARIAAIAAFEAARRAL
jgi:CHAD domain-containing protein